MRRYIGLLCILSCVAATLQGHNVRFINHTNRKIEAHINQDSDPAGWFCSSGHTHEIDAGGSWEKDYGGCCVLSFEVMDISDSNAAGGYGRNLGLRGKKAYHKISPHCGSGGDLHIWYDAEYNLKLTSGKPDPNDIPDDIQPDPPDDIQPDPNEVFDEIQGAFQ